MEQRKRPRVILPQIELIRVLCMAWIFLFHLWSAAPDAIPNEGARAVLSRGYLGVVVFNIITGLVLSLPYLGPEGRGAPTYGEFLRKRFLRIIPNYYLALGLWTLVPFVTGQIGLSASLAFGAHLAFVHTLAPETFFQIVPAYWWLGLLAQFYLLFPCLLRLYEKIGPARASLLVCAVCWGGWAALSSAARAWPESPAAIVNYMIYFNLPARLPEFAIGMWLAAAWRPLPAGQGKGGPFIPFSPGFSLLLLAALCLALGGGFLPGMDSMPAAHLYQTAWCLVAFIALFVSPTAVRIGRVKAVATMGVASYSFYLVHQPILGYSVSLFRGNAAGMSPLAGMAFLFVTALLSLVLALLLDRASGIFFGGRKKA